MCSMRGLSFMRSMFFVMGLVLSMVVNNLAGGPDISLPIPEYIPNAKALGMGNAYTSLADNISSIYYNPSGLASLYNTELYWAYEKLRFNSGSWLAGVGFPYKNLGSFGFVVNYLGNNNILRTNKSNEPLDLYSSSHLLVLAGFGQQYKADSKVSHPYYLDIGLTLKMMKHTVFNHISYGFGFDIGFRAIPKKTSLLRNFLFGFTLQNAIKIADETTDLPINLIPVSMRNIDDSKWYYPKTKFGITYFAHRSLSMSMDISKAYFIDEPINLGLGLSYRVFKFLELRTGYNHGYSFGMGLDFKEVSFNSGFNNHEDYGFIAQFGLNLRFK